MSSNERLNLELADEYLEMQADKVDMRNEVCEKYRELMEKEIEDQLRVFKAY